MITKLLTVCELTCYISCRVQQITGVGKHCLQVVLSPFTKSLKGVSDSAEAELSLTRCTDLLQVDSLTERVEELKQDKKRLVEEYEAKLSKVL